MSSILPELEDRIQLPNPLKDFLEVSLHRGPTRASQLLQPFPSWLSYQVALKYIFLLKFQQRNI